MNKPQSAQVAVTRATHYDINELRLAIGKNLDLIGGLGSFVKRGDKVFVKINHLPPASPPERGIVTHPVFTEAVVALLKDLGADVIIGDDVETADFNVSGYHEMCVRAGVQLVNLKEAGFVATSCAGKILKEVYAARTALEAEVIINLPKFKTHSLCTFTGGVKNMYGCIPTGLRRHYHGDFLRIEEFCQAVVDIYSVMPPSLTIMDGIMAMQGEGPGNGQVRQLGIILASRDTVALDAIAGKVIGLEPQDVLSTLYAGERGIGIADLSRIEVLGEKIESVAVKNFKLPSAASRFFMGKAPKGLAKLFLAQFSPRPYIRRKNCTGCKECEKVCPVAAATVNDKEAEINHALCISCMCCHEVCRFNAIVPRRPFFGNLTFGIIGALRKLGGK
jgi:uncharacterized protein (DUF362 family)/Pyruvate/2-oxoacid:ferredoxin oxidoreductase delta subunit